MEINTVAGLRELCPDFREYEENILRLIEDHADGQNKLIDSAKAKSHTLIVHTRTRKLLNLIQQSNKDLIQKVREKCHE